MRIQHWFDFAERGTDLKTEFLAGGTTFLAMMYIVVVNPTILAKAGIDFGGAYMATILASALGMLVMGIGANHPVALAPGLGISAYFSYTVVISQGVAWQDALGAACVASVLLAVIAGTRLLPIFIEAIPESMKLAITAGIGLFIAFIGLENGHIVVGSPTTVTTLGTFSDPMAFLTLIGLLVTSVMMANRVQGAVFFGMLTVGLVAYIQGFLELPAAPFALPEGLDKTFFQMSFAHFDVLFIVTFMILLVTLFDTISTLLGVTMQAGLMREGRVPRLKTAVLADALGSVFGAACGTAPLSTYAESATGVAAGGRTGFTSVVVAVLFLLLLFCLPLARSFSDLSAISAPALITVGFLMLSGIGRVKWHDVTEGFPAFIIMVVMPLSYSITNGVGAGVIFYTILKCLTGRWREVHPLMFGFAAVFMIQFVFLA
jgi:AGZA family xanthine/uracil permease-like MFS transporter